MKDHTGDPALEILLKAMRLPSILQQYRQVAAEAEQGGWDFIRFLKQLITIEVEDRRVRKLERLLKRSHLPKDKTLSSFDLARMPTKIRQIEKGDVRAERSWLFDKIINVRLLPGCDKSSHTGVGHPQISSHVGTGITQFSHRNPGYRTTGFRYIPPAAT